MKCDHPREELRPFLRELGRNQVYECWACGALVEERPRLEGVGYELVVIQEAGE